MHVSLPIGKHTQVNDLIKDIGLQTFGQKQEISQASLTKFWSFIDYAITHDGNFSVGEILDASTSYFSGIFQAKQSSLPAHITKKIEALRKQRTEYASPDLLPKGLQKQVKVLEKLDAAIDKALVKAADNSGYSRPEQIKLLNELVKQALEEARSGEGTINLTLFDKSLQSLVASNSKKFSKEGLQVIASELKQVRAEAELFSNFHSGIHNIVLKDVDPMSGENVLKYDPSEKELVHQAILEYSHDLEYGKAMNNGDEIKAQHYAQKLLLEKLEAGNDKAVIAQRHNYLKYLQNKHKELSQAQGGDLLGTLAKTFPNLLMPGVIGALIGAIFGNSFIGAMLTIGVDFLGNLDGTPANNSNEEPATVKFEQPVKSKPPVKMASGSSDRKAA